MSFTSVPGKILEQILPEAVLRHIEGREVTQDSLHSFTKGKLCLNIHEAFDSEVTTAMDKGRDIVCLEFCKAFDMVPSCILSKQETGRLKGWIVQWSWNWLDELILS